MALAPFRGFWDTQSGLDRVFDDMLGGMLGSRQRAAADAGNVLWAPRDALATLPERERTVLSGRVGLDGDPRTLTDIGKALGVSRERARQLHDAGHQEAERPEGGAWPRRPGRGEEDLLRFGRNARAPSGLE